ncbi:LOW QUALITY PROTEIN: homologous-pairing protein 2 homolog [Macrobrachium rosenbergii]|uniref:LOW QUALITY PROTEIN: homologous-pairing protein 2 homolog n=1 Tax=Macrobrachium rosenbergii TaxID=79674 RepID=UPI0034D418E9
MSKKDNEAMERVRSYMEQQNRPYSVNDIFMNLHKDIGKTAVQKVLDQLVSSGKLREKSYGKQKVYVYDQSHFPSFDENKLKEMDNEIAELNESVKEKEKLTTEVEAKLRGLNSSLTTEEAMKKVAELEEEISTLQNKLSNLQSTTQDLVSKEEKEKIEGESENMNKMWRKRKRMAMDILDAILEGYPKPKKVLLEEIGVETDEDVGVVLKKV